MENKTGENYRDYIGLYQGYIGIIFRAILVEYWSRV